MSGYQYQFLDYMYFDTLDEMISDKRIDELKAGKTEVYSLEEVAQKLGLK